MNNKSVAISKDAQNGMYSVYIFTEGLPTVQKIIINYPIAIVNDFEILEDMLYFCGTKNSGIGIVGRMSLSNIGASTEITVPINIICN